MFEVIDAWAGRIPKTKEAVWNLQTASFITYHKVTNSACYADASTSATSPRYDCCLFSNCRSLPLSYTPLLTYQKAQDSAG